MLPKQFRNSRDGFTMGSKRVRPAQVATHRPYLEGVAKNLMEKLYGPDGPPLGTSFADLEQLASQLGKTIAQELLTRSLDRQSAGAMDPGCPTCGRAGASAEPEPRVVETDFGEVLWNEPRCTCTRCRRSFFPQSRSLGIDRAGLSPAVLTKVVYAGVSCGSFALASEMLATLADLDVSAKQVERRTREIGTERCATRDEEVRDYLALPLVERKGVPEGVTAPELAVVQVDGGRLQIRDRVGAAVVPEASPKKKKKGRFWCEDKVGFLASMKGDTHAVDPCPQLPDHYLDAGRMSQLVQEIKANARTRSESVPAGEASVIPCDTPLSPTRYEAPELAVRSVVATRQDAHRFGELLATAAWQRGFYGATRRAFLGDGSNANWGVWERHFSSFTPIVDFIHALAYVYQAAMVAGTPAEGWSRYATWIGRLWSGDAESAIQGMAEFQTTVGMPEATDEETHPRRKLADALGYLRNQQGRMKYAEYRRAGLPITTSHVESTIKQINRRVKGTEKFWSEGGAEAILQLRAEVLSETRPLEAYWIDRCRKTTGERRQKATISVSA